MRNYLMIGLIGLAMATSAQAKSNHGRRNARNYRPAVVERQRSRRGRAVVVERNRRRHRRPVVVVQKPPRRRPVVVVQKPPRRRPVIVRPCPPVVVRPRPRIIVRPRPTVVVQVPSRPGTVYVHDRPAPTVHTCPDSTCGSTTTGPICDDGSVNEVVIHEPSRQKVRRRNTIIAAGVANEIFNDGRRRQKDVRKGAIAALLLNEVFSN